jgi:hypothetical protein
LSKGEVRHEGLARALAELPEFSATGPDALQPMRVGGIAHQHFRIAGRGAVLRVPQLSQFGFAPAENLAYQAAAFERAYASGRTPRLIATLPVGPDLPFGALVVEEIVGRPVRLPDDLPAIAEALARIHELPLPAPAARPPLRDHREPVAATLATILSQAEHLHDAGLQPAALTAIADELGWARQFAGEIASGVVKARQPIALVATDSHPGNFLIEESGRAVLVDLEKMLYGAPAIDLAHATLYTSTTWEREVAAELSIEQVARFYRAYLDERPSEVVAALKPWLLPMRRITWLRTITWMIRWRAVSAAKVDDPALGPWSRSRLPADQVAHMLARIEDFTDPATIARVRAEWLEHGPLESLL